MSLFRYYSHQLLLLNDRHLSVAPMPPTTPSPLRKDPQCCAPWTLKRRRDDQNSRSESSEARFGTLHALRSHTIFDALVSRIDNNLRTQLPLPLHVHASLVHTASASASPGGVGAKVAASLDVEVESTDDGISVLIARGALSPPLLKSFGLAARFSMLVPFNRLS